MIDINLNFELSGNPNGIAGSIFSRQTRDYIERMRLNGEEVIVAAMERARDQSAAEPYSMSLSQDEFSIVYNWLVNFSGFFDPALQQLKDAFA